MGPAIAALVEPAPGSVGEQSAVGRRGHLEVPYALSRLVEGQQVLAPILHPLHRAPDVDRQPGDQVVLGVELAPAAKAAAHVTLDQPDILLGHSEQLRQAAAVEMLHLGRPPQREVLALCVVLGEQRAGLHGHGAVALDPQLLFDHDVCLCEEPVNIAGAHGLLVDQVLAELRVQNRRPLGYRVQRVENRIKWLDVQLNLVGGVFCDVGVLGDHDSDRIADVAHHVDHERRLENPFAIGLREHPDRDLALREVLRADHANHSRPRKGGFNVDAVQAPERDVRSDDAGVELTLAVDIGPVLTAA